LNKTGGRGLSAAERLRHTRLIDLADFVNHLRGG
jgi:hypothetical protein